MTSQMQATLQVRRSIRRLLPTIQPLGWAIGTLLTWQDRARQRAALAALDDRLLEDIGLSRAQARAEADKPFWQR